MENILINPFLSIKEALKRLNDTAEKVLFVVDEKNTLIGTITDGDIRRHILKTGTIEGIIETIYNKNPIYALEDKSEDEIKHLIFKNKIELLPITNHKKQLVGFYRWTDFYNEEIENYTISEILDIPVVIMAGGKGTRLDPFTRVLPKALVPFKEKTIAEHIIGSFKKFGVHKFYFTLNFKGRVIESYFNSIQKDYEIEFIWEEDFLGTAGSLSLLIDKINSDFFVTNCDILLNVNYNKVYKYYKEVDASFISITSIRHYAIPYGIVYTGEQSIIKKLEEKPEHTFQINTGVYLLNKEVLNYISENTYIDMPQLIDRLLEENKKVIAYPINEKDYIDIGQWEEYRKFMKIFE